MITHNYIEPESLYITNIEIIKYCQEQFDFNLPSVLIARVEQQNFLVKLQVLTVTILSWETDVLRITYLL